MLLILEEDEILRVYDSVEAAVRKIEPLDAEETFNTIFDEHARRYRIEWIRPNERVQGCLWGFLCGATQGEYTLSPQGDRDPAALLELLRTARLEPGPHEARVRALERDLAIECGSQFTERADP